MSKVHGGKWVNALRLRGGAPRILLDEVMHRGTQCSNTSLAFRRARGESMASPHTGIAVHVGEILSETIQNKIAPS